MPLGFISSLLGGGGGSQTSTSTESNVEVQDNKNTSSGGGDQLSGGSKQSKNIDTEIDIRVENVSQEIANDALGAVKANSQDAFKALTSVSNNSIDQNTYLAGKSIDTNTSLARSGLAFASLQTDKIIANTNTTIDKLNKANDEQVSQLAIGLMVLAGLGVMAWAWTKVKQ